MPSRPPAARLAVVAAALAVSGCTPSGGAPATSAAAAPGSAAAAAPAVVIHKSATCTCCKGHEEHLEEHGYTVEHVLYDDAEALAEAKEGFGVPEAQRSCHTAVVDGYVVEGHMPAEEIDRLLAERPAVDGIALAGMPAGSPGMPGAKTQDWTIWALQDGAASVHAVR